jgi:diadenosine tetraphosphate (Ap4A) HIT family hydrolase
MAETAQEFSERVTATSDDAWRAQALQTLTSWGTFPFDTEGLRIAALDPPSPETPRSGEGGRPCGTCERVAADEIDEAEVWRDERWRLIALPPSGAPLVLMLQPLVHHDLADLPDELASELGVLQVHLARAVEALPNVARCHVLRFGDGGAHLHVFFFARTADVPQLRGSFLLVWDDLLPPTPAEHVRADADAVARALAASFGGTCHLRSESPQ